MKDDNFKKVGLFLKDITPTEYRYLELTMQMVSGMRELIEKYKLDKKEFCELFEIKPAKYENYTKGNFNYSVEDMVKLTWVWRKLETKRIQEQEMFKVGVNLNEE
jgi:hypothetical protein